MDKFSWIIFISATVGCLVFTGCEDCKPEEVASLLLPNDHEDAGNPTLVTYSELNGGITCLDSGFFEIKDNWLPTDVLSDFRSETGHSLYGSYLAAGLSVRSEAAFAELSQMGCVDALTPLPAIDWATQTLIIIHVNSNEGCMASADAGIYQTAAGIAQLNVDVTYNPSSACYFEYTRSFIVNQPVAQAHLTVIAGCSESDSHAEI